MGTRFVCMEDFRRDTIVVTGMAVSDRRPWQVTACGQHASVSSLSAVCKAGSVHILKWRYATLDTQEVKIAFLQTLKLRCDDRKEKPQRQLLNL